MFDIQFKKFVKMKNTDRVHKYSTPALVVVFFFTCIFNSLSQVLPIKCFENQKDFSYMWWMKTIKSGNKIFAIKTSHYALSFDYPNLALTNLIINKNESSEDVALRETNTQSFPANNSCSIRFGMLTDNGTYWCNSNTKSLDDCQLIENGKYFQRRFINKLPDLIGCDIYNSGLEISSWPDRFSFILRATPGSDLTNRGLLFYLTLPTEYSVLLEQGEFVALKNPADGSGFIFLKSANATSLTVSGTTIKVKLDKVASCPAGKEISAGMIVYPVASNIETRLAEIAEQESVPVTVTAQQTVPIVKSLVVGYDRNLGWHHIDLRNDGNTADYSETSNKRIERVKLVFTNPSSKDKVVRLNFAKERSTGVSCVTGLSAVLRDASGNPIGIPIQLSKNWHTSTSADLSTQYFRGTWYHGLSMLTIPANTSITLEYTSLNALWGGIPAASHAQLCLVGWGSNQQWDQSAIGSWGETITYEPDMAQTGAPVLDYRPLMIKGVTGQKWGWTGNMGGADFFNYTKTNGARGWHSRIRTQYKRYSPNYTEVTFAGTMDDNSMDFEYSASLGRSDDLSRGIYHIKLKVLNDISFNDFAFFQVAAPTYHYIKSNTLAWGNETGLKKQWSATIGGASRYVTAKQVAEGKSPWFSFTDSEFAGSQPDFRPANRGVVIRSWKARINGKDNVLPYFAEYNATGGNGESSGIINITPPTNCTSFKAGDSIEAVVELFQIPKYAADYYGPNQNLLNALTLKPNSWEMIYREAIGNNLEVSAVSGCSVIDNYPVKVEANGNTACFTITGGRGYVPVTITNVESYSAPVLYQKINGAWQKINQAVYGNDFWQTEYNASAGKWEITYNVNLDSSNDVRQTLEFKFESSNITDVIFPLQNRESQLRIYPNPSKGGKFHIQFDETNSIGSTKVNIVDMLGRSVFERVYTDNTNLFVEANLSSGIYLVYISNRYVTKSLKLYV